MLYPVKFEPIFKPRIWGGRRLEQLFGKPLPVGQTIGESWELSGLPGDESIVANGPLAGHRLTDLVNRFGAALLGAVSMSDGRDKFPLLIKLLDARQALSVQVHPGRGREANSGAGDGPAHQTGADSEGRWKDECWYIIDAEPGARIWVGLNDGVSRDQFAAAVRNGAVEPLLRVQPVRAGDFFYLPGGTVHALGAGIVVAEVQTPSDTTYRLFDWNRIDAATGKGRKLHVAEALAVMDCGEMQNAKCKMQNAKWNSQPVDKAVTGGRSGQPVASGLPFRGKDAEALLDCENFTVVKRRLSAGERCLLGGNERMTVWQILSGRGRIDCGDEDLNADFAAGELVLIPAAMPAAAVAVLADCELLEVTIPHG